MYSLGYVSYNSICSPSGKLVQIEYALNAVNNAPPSVSIKGMLLQFVYCLLTMCCSERRDRTGDREQEFAVDG
jgi:hypothetical protein